MPSTPPCPPSCRSTHPEPTPGVPLNRSHRVPAGEGTGGGEFVLDTVWPDGRVEVCTSPRVDRGVVCIDGGYRVVPLPDVDDYVDDVDGLGLPLDLDEVLERFLRAEEAQREQRRCGRGDGAA